MTTYDNIYATMKSTPLSKHKKKELAILTAKRWKDATQVIRPLLEDDATGWDYYLQNCPEDTEKDREKVIKTQTRKRGVRLGQIPKVVDTLLSVQHSMSFPVDDRFFRGRPKNEFSAEIQELYESSLADRMAKANISTQFRNYRLAMIIAGTAALHVKHITKKRTKMVYKPNTEPVYDPLQQRMVDVPSLLSPMKEVEEEVTEYDGACVEVLNFSDWRIDPYGSDYESTWFIRRMYMSSSKVKRMFPKAKVTSHYDSVWTTDSQYQKRKDHYLGLEGYTRSMDSLDEEDGKTNCLIMTHYGDFEIGDEYYENHVVVVLNDTEILYFGKNPYNHGRKPYVVCPYIQIPGQLYGLSAIKHALPSAELIDISYNAILENAKWMSFPVFVKNINCPSMRKLGDLQITPGMTIPVTRPDSIAPLNIPLGNISLMQSLIASAQQNIEDVTGANSIVQGEAPTMNRVSAFEIDIRSQNAGARFQTIIDTFNNLALEPSVQMMYENDKQFKTVVDIVGTEFISPDDIKATDYDFTITSLQATMAKNRRIQMYQELITSMGPALAEAGLISFKTERMEVNQNELLKRLMTESGFPDIANILKEISPEEAAQQNQQAQQIPTPLPEDMPIDTAQQGPPAVA